MKKRKFKLEYGELLEQEVLLLEEINYPKTRQKCSTNRSIFSKKFFIYIKFWLK
jgi:hypothetical protein